MGLLDKAKAEIRHYIEFDTFIFYLSYFTNETLTDVVTWLSYNIDELDSHLVCYDILDDYRILEKYDENDKLFVTEGIINKLNELGFFSDELDRDIFDFYFDIRELHKLDIFLELKIDFYNAINFKYILTESTDKVTLSDKSPYQVVNGKQIYNKAAYFFDKKEPEIDESNPYSKIFHHIYQQALSNEQGFETNQVTLQNQSHDKELTATSQKAVAKLLYALLKEHKYELGAKKGTTNDILESLTAKHGVKISRETIAKWLDIINTLDK